MCFELILVKRKKPSLALVFPLEFIFGTKV